MVEAKCTECSQSFLIPDDLASELVTSVLLNLKNIEVLRKEIKKFHNCNYSEEA